MNATVKRAAALLICAVLVFGFFCSCGFTDLVFVSSSSKDSGEQFDIPRSGGEIREIATDHIRKMSSVKSINVIIG